MDEYSIMQKGIQDIVRIIRTSRVHNIRQLSALTNRINGTVFLKHVNKTVKTDNGNISYNVIRIYAPTSSGCYPWIDLRFRFREYVKDKKPTQVIAKDVIHSWVNLEDCYVEFFLEEAPMYENSENTRVLINEETDVYEMIVDEANYFYLRCQDIKSKHTDTTPPTKDDSVANVFELCDIMKGK